MPNSLTVTANALEHHVLEWASDPTALGRKPLGTVFLVHGYMDAAGTWAAVAPALAAAGLRVLAPDMRGFGDGARTPRGSYYHFADYVFDLADLADALVPREPFALVGHSMGGTVATLFAGAFPERVRRLVSMEGLGPPDNPWEVGPTRMRRWIDDVRRARARGEDRPTFTRDEALKRLAANHPNVPDDVLARVLEHLVAEIAPGRFAWRNDPLHRTTSPMPFYAANLLEFAKRVSCPMLFVGGGDAGYHPPDEAARVAAFPQHERIEIDGAGHMMHWTRPDEVARVLVSFLASP
jgi:pimeloyl-ACP methyl ester carboxylesterase